MKKRSVLCSFFSICFIGFCLSLVAEADSYRMGDVILVEQSPKDGEPQPPSIGIVRTVEEGGTTFLSLMDVNEFLNGGWTTNQVTGVPTQLSPKAKTWKVSTPITKESLIPILTSDLDRTILKKTWSSDERFRYATEMAPKILSKMKTDGNATAVKLLELADGSVLACESDFRVTRRGKTKFECKGATVVNGFSNQVDKVETRNGEIPRDALAVFDVNRTVNGQKKKAVRRVGVSQVFDDRRAVLFFDDESADVADTADSSSVVVDLDDREVRESLHFATERATENHPGPLATWKGEQVRVEAQFGKDWALITREKGCDYRSGPGSDSCMTATFSVPMGELNFVDEKNNANVPTGGGRPTGGRDPRPTTHTP